MARLLIIEDGVPLASLLVSATSARGHLTTAAHTGREGLTLAREEPFALAVVDLLLPDLRGAEVLEALRGLRVPCIAMSGVFKGDRFAKDAVEQHGALAFFEKPFDLNGLLDAIDAIVGPQPVGDELPEVGGLEDLDIDVDEESGVLELQPDDIVEDEVTPRAAVPYVPTEEEALALASPGAASGPAPRTDDDHGAGPQEAIATTELRVSAAAIDDERPQALSAPPVSTSADDAEISFADVLDDPNGDDARASGTSTSTSAADHATELASDHSEHAEIDQTPAAPEDPPSAEDLAAFDGATAPARSFTGESPAITADAPGSTDDDASFDGLLSALEPDTAAPGTSDDVSAAPRHVDAVTPFSDRGQVWEAPVPSARRVTTQPTSELGRLERSALVGLLNACHQSRFTGSLELSTDGDDLSLRFHGGLAVGAVTSRPEGSFTRHGIEHGALTEVQAQSVDALASSDNLSQDEALERLALLDEETVAQLRRAHLEALVARALAWSGGTSRLVAREREHASPPPGSLSVPELVFAASLVNADLNALREVLPDETRLTPTADPPYELGELPLSDAQAYLLAHTDGSKRVADLHILSELEELEVLVTLHVMVQLGILEPRKPSRSSRRITFGL